MTNDPPSSPPFGQPIARIAPRAVTAEPRHRVLVIDDSVSARTAAKEILDRAGFEVFALPSAIGATRLILRNRIEAVVVDLSMPGLSGDRLVGLLRENPRLRGLIVVIVSGESPEELKRVAESTQVDGVLSKESMGRELPTLLRRRFARGVLPGSEKQP